jgi:pyrroloquinoline-quinone synthase
MDLPARIDGMIEERHLLRHSFYRAWLDGTLPIEALREYARQYFAFESNFPRFLSGLHTRCERADVRAALLDNLWDEDHGEANHRELWLRFAEGLGVHRDEVAGAEWNDATRALVEAYRGASSAGPVVAGVAAVYAYERQVPAVAQAKMEGLRQRYGVQDARTLGFFEVHATLDVEHSDAERRILAGAGDDEAEAVLETAAVALDAWWAFLDAVDPQATVPAA